MGVSILLLMSGAQLSNRIKSMTYAENSIAGWLLNDKSTEKRFHFKLWLSLIHHTQQSSRHKSRCMNEGYVTVITTWITFSMLHHIKLLPEGLKNLHFVKYSHRAASKLSQHSLGYPTHDFFLLDSRVQIISQKESGSTKRMLLPFKRGNIVRYYSLLLTNLHIEWNDPTQIFHGKVAAVLQSSYAHRSSWPKKIPKVLYINRYGSK